MKRVLFWGLVGGAVAIPLDALHVVTGVLTYRTPRLGLQDWWAVPLFISAGIMLGMTHRHVAMPLTRKNELPPSTISAALLGLGALVFAYASSGALQSWPIVALASYVAVWLMLVARVHAQARLTMVFHSIGAGIVGPLVEIAISSTGAFSYTHPDIFGVALWLPGIYLNAGAATHLLDRWLLTRAAGS